MAATRAGRSAVGLIDQMVYSLTNFVMTIVVAHYSSATEFGVYSVLVATFLIPSAMNRGLTAEPLVIRYSAAGQTEWRNAAVNGVALAFTFGLCAGALLAVASLFLPSGFTPMAWVFAGSMPGLFVQDFVRFAALASGRPTLALLNDGTVAFVQACATAAAIVSGVASPTAFVAVWGVAGLLGGLVAIQRLGIIPSHGVKVRAVFAEWDLSGRLSLDNFVTQLGTQGSGYLIAGIAGLEQAAGVRAALTLFMPAAVLTLGVQAAITPELVRIKDRSLRRMRRLLWLLAAALVGVVVLVDIAAIVCPDRIGKEVFGASWLAAKPMIQFIGYAQIGSVLINSAVIGLRVLADAPRTLRARSIGMAVSLGCVGAGAAIDGGKGASVGLAVAAAVQAPLWWSLFAASFTEAKSATASERINRRWLEVLESVPPSRRLPEHSRVTGERMRAALGIDDNGSPGLLTRG
jgi:hypothetical protein